MSAWNKGRLVLGAAVAAGALAVVAVAQEPDPPTINVRVRATPNTAGTPRHPRSIAIDARVTIIPAGLMTTADESADPDVVAPPMPRSIDVWLPKGWHYNGAGRPVCTRAMLAHGGIGECPEGSRVSKDGVLHADVVDGYTPPRVTIFNGGPAALSRWVVIQDPARVAVAITATLTKLRSPHWSSRLHADVPDSLRVISGIPISLKSLQADVRDGGWFTTTYCPHDHKWRTHLRLTYPSGQVADDDGAAACRTWPPRRPLVVP